MDDSTGDTTPQVSDDERRDLMPFLALEAATVISGTGNGVAAIALPWLTLQLTHDPAAAGVVVAAGAVPTLIASLASGVIIDRLGRQRTSVGSDVFSASSAAMIPAFGLLGILSYPLVLLASVIGAIFDPVGVTAREAMLPDVARRARLPLERVNGVHEAIWNVAWLIGPGVAGVLIGLVGAVASFWAMFAGFAASAVLVATACMPTAPAAERVRVHPVKEAWEGLSFLLRDPAIRSSTVLVVLSFTVAYSAVAVVLPVVFEARDQPERLGILFMMFSGGGVLGALAYSAWGTRTTRRALFLAGMIAAAAVAGIFAITDNYWIQISVMALAGFISSAANPINNVVIQERTSEAMRGRVLSMAFSLAYALFPLGYVVSGFLIKAIGTTATFAWMSVAGLAVAAWAAVSPALRAIDESPTDSGPDARSV